MGPAAVDGFLGFANDMGDVANEEDERNGIFQIPHELLMKLPIAQVTSDTRIIALNTTANNEIDGIIPSNPPASLAGSSGTISVDTHVQVTPSNPEAPKAGPSGILEKRVIEAMETDDIRQEENVENPEPIPIESQPTSSKIPGAPKKGFNTKNKKQEVNNRVCPVPPPAQENDPALQDRMNILQEIVEVVRSSKGRADMTEMQVWGQYMSFKACRIPEGPIRDDILVEVEKIMNKGIHGRWGQEE